MMKKSVLVILLMILIVYTSISASALVSTGDKVVITDDNWAYEKNKGYGYEIDEYIGEGTEIEIPWSFAKEYVTVIGDYAFNIKNNISSVMTTSVLQRIGNYAFNFCTSLQKITLYESLIEIGNSCFYGTAVLTDINLQDTNIQTVPDYCFAESGIIEIKLPDTCTSIGNMAFYNCKGLSKIIIPDSTNEISNNAFSGCDNIVIYGTKNSYAIEYARENDIDYVITDYTTVTFMLGDADGDESLTIADATTIQQLLAHLITDDDGMITLRGDVDEDGLTIVDVTKIQRKLVNLPVEEPVGQIVTKEVYVG